MLHRNYHWTFNWFFHLKLLLNGTEVRLGGKGVIFLLRILFYGVSYPSLTVYLDSMFEELSYYSLLVLVREVVHTVASRTDRKFKN